MSLSAHQLVLAPNQGDRSVEASISHVVVSTGSVWDGIPKGLHLYRLKCVIGYYPGHYKTFMRQYDSSWLLIDDEAEVHRYETSAEFITACEAGKTQPAMVFYEAVKQDGPLPTPSVPRQPPHHVRLAVAMVDHHAVVPMEATSFNAMLPKVRVCACSRIASVLRAPVRDVHFSAKQSIAGILWSIMGSMQIRPPDPCDLCMLLPVADFF